VAAAAAAAAAALAALRGGGWRCGWVSGRFHGMRPSPRRVSAPLQRAGSMQELTRPRPRPMSGGARWR
jgi:hypothetical protein